MLSNRVLPRLLQLLLVLNLILPATSVSTVISNIVPRYDTNGSYVNAHDGCLIQYNQTFYQYGTVYEECIQEGPICDGKCGYLGNIFSVYSSPDLQTWTLLNENVLPELNKDNDHVSYWEANVGYHADTDTFFMFYWNGNYGFKNNSVAVAVSSTGPQGPFINIPPVNVHGSTIISDTVGFFVDDDGTGYLRYNTIDLPRRHVIEKLDPTWKNTTGEYSIIFAKPDFPWYDGGGILKRKNKYYVMLSFDCCFCQWGSDALVFVSDHPLGPWVPQTSTAASKRSSSDTWISPSIASSPSSPSCNLTGSWSGVFPGDNIAPPTLAMYHYGNNTVQLTGASSSIGTYNPSNNSVIFPIFPGYSNGTLVGQVSAYNDTLQDKCSNILWLNYNPNGTYWCKYPVCTPPVVPPANWTNEVNLCSTGLNPPESVQSMYINPCSQYNVNGPNFTIPSQQFNIATFTNSTGYTYYLYYGEHFRSSTDGLKAHDLQTWIPLQFDDHNDYNRLLPMVWMDQFTMEL